ncbi:hypothetical protein Vadar_025991 [Vaccinium darrowii]|uniref:Uncharacterized protein n=1 Tax=Vaccinium darrowii TaxID=229202 RepID=A0ACB7Y3C9_9ERIC|nr:hypothetical protein Vadar_025991 [Vaccinium darrowii]
MDPPYWGNANGSNSTSNPLNDFGNFAGWLGDEIFQPNYFNYGGPNQQPPPPYTTFGGFAGKGDGSSHNMEPSCDNFGGQRWSSGMSPTPNMGTPYGEYGNNFGHGAGPSYAHPVGAEMSSDLNWDDMDDDPEYRSVGGFMNQAVCDDDEDRFSLPDDDLEADIWYEADMHKLCTIALLQAVREHQKQLKKKKIPFHTSPLQGRGYMDDLWTSHLGRFYQVLKMLKRTFTKIVEELKTIYGWTVGRSDAIDCDESLAMFIHLLRGYSNVEIQERFQHSGETVSRQIHKILRRLRKFNYDKLQPTRSQDDPHPYLDRRPFYAPFKGKCIDALDGTHIIVRCRKKEDDRKFFRRKGYATQNILVACDFDLTFVYASAGWEGSFHDNTIFKRVVYNPRYQFPQSEEGKFYLVDVGYPNKLGFLAPYKGYRYHQEDFRRGRRFIRSDNEFFNRAHSSLRSCIERTIGVFKSTFPVVYRMPWYSLRTQVQIVLSGMAFHNFIRRDRDPEDDVFRPVENQLDYTFQDLADSDPTLEDREDMPQYGVLDDENNPHMNCVRNNIREQLRRQRITACIDLHLVHTEFIQIQRALSSHI